MRVAGMGKLSWLKPGPPGKSCTRAVAALLIEAKKVAVAAALQKTVNGTCFTDSKIAPACVIPDLVVLLAFIVITLWIQLQTYLTRRL